MAEKESDVIEHLLSLEHEASSLLVDAQTTADKRVSEARARADEAYKKQYGELLSKADVELKSESDKITKNHEAAFSAYQNRISASEKDVPAFNALLDKLFFAE